MDETVYAALKRGRAPVPVAPYLPEPIALQRWRSGPLPSAPVPHHEGSFTLRKNMDDAWHLLVPLRQHDLIGVLAVGARDDDQPYGETDLKLIFFLARRYALALDYVLNYSELRLAFERRRDLDHLLAQVAQAAQQQMTSPFSAIKQAEKGEV